MSVLIVASNRKWGLSIPYSTISVFLFPKMSRGLTIISSGLNIVVGEMSHITLQMFSYLRFDKPSDHGQFRDGKTQTRASHRISHDPKVYLTPVGPKCHFRNLRGHFCKYFGTKNVRNLGPGGKNVILTKVRGQKRKFSARWSDQPCGSATLLEQLGPVPSRHLVEHLVCDQNVRNFKSRFRLRFSTNLDVVCSYLLEIKRATIAPSQFHEKEQENVPILKKVGRGGGAVAVTASDAFPASSGLALGRDVVAGVRGLEWKILDFPTKQTLMNSPTFVLTLSKLMQSQVGDATKDHACWERPEDMDTPRTVIKIDRNTPGTEVAAETVAALASASLVFRKSDRTYSKLLLKRAISYLRFDKPSDHGQLCDGETQTRASHRTSHDPKDYFALGVSNRDVL
ncbi:hypothetical protein LXL04_003629 [Taraxacum kok-saghyz]